MIKKLLSLLIAASLAFPFTAFSGQKNFIYEITSFEKGQNSHINSYLTPKNQVQKAQNVRVNKFYGEITKREPSLTLLDFGSDPVKGLHRFYETDGTMTTIAALGTTLKINNAGTAQTIDAGLSDGKRWQCVTYVDMDIWTNGSDQPVKYDGHTQVTANTDGSRTATELCAELGAPFAEQNTGANLDASSWYQYKVAFYNGTTYYFSNARSNPILTGSSVQDIALTDVPLGQSGTTHRYIYRTLGGASQAVVEADTTFYWVGTIADNSTTTFSDTVADGTADDDAAPTWATVSAGSNVTPPTAPYITIHDEKVFLAGNTTYPSNIYWSVTSRPDFFLPTNYDVIREDDGDEITFIKTHLSVLTVGKTNTIQRYYTDATSQSDWYYSDPFSHIGCPAPYSVDNTPIGIIYLARHGLFKFDGQNSQLISDAVTDVIDDISQVNIEETVGHYNNNEYLLAYTSTYSGDTYNNRVLIYDIIRDAYVVDTKNVDSFTSFNAGTDIGTLYSGSSTSDGYVFAHSGSKNVLRVRYGEQMDDGTYDDTRLTGAEESPSLEIGWDCTIDGWLTELQTKDASIDTIDEIETYIPAATIDRPDTSGTWTSAVYRVDAELYDKIYWNERLGQYGNVTFQVRSGATAVACAAASWSSAFSYPNGSDISDETASTFIQVRANLSTTDIDYTPTVYYDDGFVFKIVYSKEGAYYESEVSGVIESGWTDFGGKGVRKLLTEIRVYYTGDRGTLSVNYKNDEADVDKTFDIDLGVNPLADTSDLYFGNNDEKIYVFYPPINSVSDPSALGRFFKFTITDDADYLTNWSLQKIEVRGDVVEVY